MSSWIYHRCHHCGYETDIAGSMRAFEENPFCRQCGLSASEGDSKMTDELSNLMAQSLRINNTIPTQSMLLSNPPTPPTVPQPSPITYITQHYHHSNHQAPELLNASSPLAALRAGGIDPSTLSHTQIQLFQNADAEQQNRLMELWRIAPPTPDNHALTRHLTGGSNTSFQLEEEAARYRWERMEAEKFKNLSVSHAEPYIANGYHDSIVLGPDDGQMKQDLPRATVYNNQEWWKLNDRETMENQYGILQHMQLYGQQLDQSAEAEAGADEEML